jgi:poly(3-hydroxybutyrate) depolymerase
MILKTPPRRNLLVPLTALWLAACGDGSVGSAPLTGSGGNAGAFQSGGASGQGASDATSGSGGDAGPASGAGPVPTGGTAPFAGAGAGGSLGGEAGAGGGGVSGGQAGGAAGSGGQAGMPGGRPISFGTLLEASTVVSSARALAQSLAKPGAAQWRAKGDQRRTYRFPETGRDEPYRLYVPTDWDGTSSLPLAMFLHGSGSDESSYLDQNGGLMLDLAQEHGYLLVSPLGASGAYGNFLRLSAPFGDEAGAAELMAAVTPATERTNAASEQDVINVLELVMNEYPIDPEARFLFGHSMGSGGTWYLGGKYANYWRGLAPMSGPFVQETGYPWDAVRGLSLFVTEGTRAPSLDASTLLVAWLTKNGFTSQYSEVDADHGGMVPLVLPKVFEFFDAARKQ